MHNLIKANKIDHISAEKKVLDLLCYHVVQAIYKKYVFDLKIDVCMSSLWLDVYVFF